MLLNLSEDINSGQNFWILKIPTGKVIYLVFLRSEFCRWLRNSSQILVGIITSSLSREHLIIFRLTIVRWPSTHLSTNDITALNFWMVCYFVIGWQKWWRWKFSLHWSARWCAGRSEETWMAQITCLWHIFTKNVLFSAKCLFFVKINNFNNIFDHNRKNLPCFKRKQENNHETNLWFRRFGIHENMSRTC